MIVMIPQCIFIYLLFVLLLITVGRLIMVLSSHTNINILDINMSIISFKL